MLLRKKNIIVTIAWIALFAIAQHLFIHTYWLHTHVAADGYMYIHAHPFNNSTDTAPVKTHHHSKSDFFILDNAGLLFATLVISIFVHFTSKYTKLPVISHIHAEEFLLLAKQGRAPPWIYFF